jgi:hypothetical protein
VNLQRRILNLLAEIHWVKGIFLGKTEGQDAFIIYDGNKVLLTFPVMGFEPGLLQGLFMSHL